MVFPERVVIPEGVVPDRYHCVYIYRMSESDVGLTLAQRWPSVGLTSLEPGIGNVHLAANVTFQTTLQFVHSKKTSLSIDLQWRARLSYSEQTIVVYGMSGGHRNVRRMN